MMTWDNPFEPCTCEDLTCPCSGGFRNFAAPYEQVLDTLRPRRIFEWGPGENTRLALRRKFVKQVIAVEPKEEWVPDIRDPRFACYVQPVNAPAFADLTFYPGGQVSDLYFIDVHRRVDCLSAVRAYGPEDTIVCLHDAQRQRYHQALAAFDFVKFLHRGFAVASDDERIMDLKREV